VMSSDNHYQHVVKEARRSRAALIRIGDTPYGGLSALLI